MHLSHIPKYTYLIVVHCGIFFWHIAGFFRLVYSHWHKPQNMELSYFFYRMCRNLFPRWLRIFNAISRCLLRCRLLCSYFFKNTNDPIKLFSSYLPQLYFPSAYASGAFIFLLPMPPGRLFSFCLCLPGVYFPSAYASRAFIFLLPMPPGVYIPSVYASRVLIGLSVVYYVVKLSTLSLWCSIFWNHKRSNQDILIVSASTLFFFWLCLLDTFIR